MPRRLRAVERRAEHSTRPRYVGHNLALLAVRWRWRIGAGMEAAMVDHPARQPLAPFTRAWSRGANASVNASAGAQCLGHQIVVAVGPRSAA